MTETETKLRAAKRMAEQAEDCKEIKRCTEGEAMFWLEDTEARVPGHVYSYAGRAEVKISGMCEYHFDDWFKE